MQTAESAQADKAAAGAEAPQESLRVSRSWRVSRSVPAQKKKPRKFHPRARVPMLVPKKIGVNSGRNRPAHLSTIRREVKHEVARAQTPDSSSHPRARFHAPQAQPWRRPYARSRSSSSSSRRVALCALGHSPAHARNRAAAPCATQEDDGEIAIPYVQLEELLKHGIAAGTPSSAIASSCAPPRMMSSSVPPHHPCRPQATSGS